MKFALSPALAERTRGGIILCIISLCLGAMLLGFLAAL